MAFAKEKTVSRNHCVIEVAPPRCTLRNLSDNGTVLNGRKITEEAELEDGARLVLGRDTEVLVRIEGIAAPSKSPQKLPCRQCGGPLEPGKSALLCERCLGSGIFSTQPFPGLEVMATLGEGGMGTVYLARHIARGDLVAVKTMKPEVAADARRINSFLREGKNGARIRHPNAVRLYDGGFAHGVFFFLMEYVRGLDAAASLKERGKPYSVKSAVSIIRQVVGAVEVAHGLGMVHRDIKPQNIMIAAESRPGPLAKLTDFGLMRSFEDVGLSFITKTGSAKGTPDYMPPEQVDDAKHVGPTSDIYALGATLHFLLSGKTRIDLKNAAHFIIAILEKPPTPLRSHAPKAPAVLEEIILRCLAKEPRERFQSAWELDEALAGVRAR